MTNISINADVSHRPLLGAALTVVDAHITAHPNTIDDLKGRWDA